jgi:LSD1 subclass zinc finger protein
MSNDFNEKTHDVAAQSKVKCKECGGLLEFTPGAKSLTCQYCGTQNEIVGASAEPIETEELDFNAFINNAIDTADTMQITTVKCDSCGSAATLKPNVTADSCGFCGTALVIQGGSTSSIIKPAYLLPFGIDKKKGLDLFVKWLGDLWFAPNDLKKYAENDKLKGMYIPYWTYDSNTITHYTGMRGDHYYVTETYTVNGQTQTRQVQRTRWTPAAGTVYNEFDDILINASKSLPEKLAQELEPWDLDKLDHFKEEFLAGFVAEKYQVDVKEGFEKAKKRMEPEIRSTACRNIGGDTQQITTLNSTYNDITFKHILLPVWLSAFKYNEKIYRFMINARTGEVQGERPYSTMKIVLAVLGGLAVIGAAIYLYMKFKN